MEVILPANLEEKLSRLAAEQGRDRSSLVVEAVERMVGHEVWFLSEVEKGLAELERGQVLNHEDLVIRIEERLTQRRSA
jgi:predicted transcriptional regulator